MNENRIIYILKVFFEVRIIMMNHIYATPEMVEIFDFYTISRMLEKRTQSKIVCFSAKVSKSPGISK